MNRFPYLMMAAAALAIGLASCSSPSFDNIPRTGYITHLQKARGESAGFASYWAVNTIRPETERRSQPIYLKPVTLEHYVSTGTATPHDASLKALCKYFDTELRGTLAMESALYPNFHLVNAPGEGVYTMEVALLSSQPTNIKGNALATATDNLVGSLAGQLVRDSDDAGFVCMGAKFYDPQGKLIMEVADWAKGDPDKATDTQLSFFKHSFNIRDFQRYGYARQSINKWVVQLVSLFTTRERTVVWYRLSGS